MVMANAFVIYIEALTPRASMFDGPPAQFVVAVARDACERMGCPLDVSFLKPPQHIQIPLCSNGRTRTSTPRIRFLRPSHIPTSTSI